MIKWLIVLPVIFYALTLSFSSCLPVAGRQVLAQTSTAVQADAGATDTGKSHSATHGDPFARVFGVLALIVTCAAIGRFGAKKLKQSPVLGELAVGIIVGAIIYQARRPDSHYHPAFRPDPAGSGKTPH